MLGKELGSVPRSRRRPLCRVTCGRNTYSVVKARVGLYVEKEAFLEIELLML